MSYLSGTDEIGGALEQLIQAVDSINRVIDEAINANTEHRNEALKVLFGTNSGTDLAVSSALLTSNEELKAARSTLADIAETARDALASS